MTKKGYTQSPFEAISTKEYKELEAVDIGTELTEISGKGGAVAKAEITHLMGKTPRGWVLLTIEGDPPEVTSVSEPLPTQKDVLELSDSLW